MVNITSPYKYEDLKRTYIGGKRLYKNSHGSPVPSVTTILDATKPAEARKKLQEWKERVGEEEATRISTESATIGNHMHDMLEAWAKNEEYTKKIPPLANMMAKNIIRHIEPHISEVWGAEARLCNPELYAGTTDLVGVWKGKDSIMDFKNARQMKKEEWIDDYFLQGAAYALAHNEVYGTDIHHIAIFMADWEGNYKTFETLDRVEFDLWAELWNRRVEEYYVKKHGLEV